MSRLLDRVLDSPRCVLHNDTKSLLFSCPYIDISNVTRYFEAHYTKPTAYLEVARSFNLAPPFHSFWLESKARKIHPELDSYGMLFRATDFETVKRAENFPESFRLEPAPKWMLIGEIFVELPRNTFGPVYGFAFPVAANGEQSYVPEVGPANWITDLVESKPAEGDSVDIVLDMLAPAFLALTFMHCNNVSLVKNVPAAALQKKHLKRSLRKRPLVTYETIVIEPATNILRLAGC